MKREILFRGKRVDGKGWAEGNFLISQKSDKTWYIIADILSSELMAIVPESLGQFTGLLDKNGKRIFEGDAVRVHEVHDDWLNEQFEVRFFQGMFILVNKATENRYTSLGYFFDRALFNDKFDRDCMKVDGSLFEIIGNIHDSPNLLK